MNLVAFKFIQGVDKHEGISCYLKSFNYESDNQNGLLRSFKGEVITKGK